MLANHKGEIPFFLLLIPFLSGIGLAVSFPHFDFGRLFTCLLVTLGIVYTILNFTYKTFSLYKRPLVGGFLLNCILLLSGWICAVNYDQLKRTDHFSKQNSDQLLIIVANEPVIKNGLVRFVANVNEVVNKKQLTIASGKLLISIKDSTAISLKYGDVVLIPSRYNVVEPPFNPAEFNYKQYLANQNIYHQAYLYPRQYRLIGHKYGNPVTAFSLQLRRKLVDGFKHHMKDTAAIAVASTMILGYKADLSDDVLQTYSTTGTLHILSVSGAHVAIVFMLLNWGLLFLNHLKYGKTARAVLIISLIWGYALLTGFSPAVNRAALMISLVIIGNTFFFRYVNPLNLLAASAFALLLYNPYYISDVGFQLSYLAIGGLIVFQPILYKSLVFQNKWMDKLWSLCSVSIAAQLITFPLSAYYFHQFPMYFLLSNLFILLPVIAIMYIGFAFLLLADIPLLGEALGFLLEKSIVLLNKGLALIGHLPLASINKLWISKAEYLLLYAIVILFFYFLYNKNKKVITGCLALVVVLMLSTGWKKFNSTNASSITFLNLKKEGGIVFKNGPDAVVISELKPADKNYKYSILPGLDSVGVATTKTLGFAQDTITPYMKKKHALIQFRDKKILILDSTTSDIDLKIDYLFVTHQPPLTVFKNLNAQLVVINADNSDRYIDSLKKHLHKKGKNYYVLKRNKALNLVSN